MRWAALVALVALGCGESVVTVTEGYVHPDCQSQAWIEVTALDVWGRSVSAASITGATNGSRAALPAGVDLTWEVGVDGLLPTTVTGRWDGALAAAGFTATATGGARTAVSADVLAVGDDDKGCLVYGLFVGLDHAWYAAGGRPPRAGNKVDLLLDGQEKWERVFEDLAAAAPERVHLSTWWWMSDFELVRYDDHHLLSPEQRTPTTMLHLLEQRGGDNRVVVARFAEDTAPGMAYLNTDPALRAHGLDPTDGIEVMLQGNPTPAPLFAAYQVPALPFSFVARVRKNPTHSWRGFHEPIGQVTGALEALEGASYHQKSMSIDGRVAYVSGMNVKSTDWDTNDHLIFDHRRMRFAATQAEREAVMAKEAMSDTGPRKDYAMRLEGPAAQDVDDIIRVRWDYGLKTGAMFEGDQTPYSLLPLAEGPGLVTAQVQATMPDPLQERSILESLQKSLRNAEDLIYIEDQYWRAPILHDAIIGAMDEHPQAVLIVVTKPVPLLDGGKKYTVVADETFRTRYPDRYLVVQLKSFDRTADEVFFVNMDVHSKITFVDDVYVNVGSANKNNRGLLYEGELNVAVHDQPFVAPARDRVLVNLVGAELADQVVGQDGATIYAALEALAIANAAVEVTLLADPQAPVQPQGFVYPLEFTPEYLLEVGPDVF